jgi:hypothetical protein
MHENRFLALLSTIATVVVGLLSLGLIIWAIGWFIDEMIKSWQTKDENYRRDCIVLPIALGILALAGAVLGLDALFHFIPYAYLNSISGIQS